MDIRQAEYEVLRDQEIDYWRHAAARQRAMHNLDTAVTFDNMAWLLEHQDSWLAIRHKLEREN